MAEGERRELICVAPASKEVFRLNSATGEFVHQHVSPETKAKINEENSNLLVLKAEDLCDWDFSSSACRTYRTRKVRSSLLQKNASQYPVYTTSRELSSAFADKTDIVLHVDALKYLDPEMIVPMDSIDHPPVLASFRLLPGNKQLEIKASLVTSASETIRSIVNDAYKLHRIAIRPSSEDNELILKIKGRREYLAGNLPLLAFEGIRDKLRETDTIEVTLMDVPRENKDFFPPLLFEGQSFPDVIPYVLFWYPPEKLIETDPPVVQRPNSSQLNLPRLHSLLAPRPRTNIETLAEALLSGEELPSVNFTTGECDWPLRVCVVGCERLGKILLEGKWGTATNAGICPPSCIVKATKRKDKARDERRSSSQAPPSDGEGQGLMPSQPVSRGPGKGTFSTFTNLNIDRGAAGNALANMLELPYAIKQVKFETMLIYGESVLSSKSEKKCAKFTQPVQFAYNVSVNEWIDFHLPISCVPKETRVCINIYGIGLEGEYIIGCAAKTLYDEFGNIRTGLQVLNIWPFYKIDPRLACMTDFWGKSNITPKKGIELTDLGDAATDLGYGRLFLSFESFLPRAVPWSLRDYEYMKGWREKVAKPLSYKVSDEVRVEDRSNNDLQILHTKPKTEDIAGLEELVDKDSLTELEEYEKKQLFCCRDHYKTLPLSLPLFLRSLDWTQPLQVKEALNMLKNWTPMSPEDAICLLDTEFADEMVRFYGVRLISQMADDQLTMYMQQLVQALQCETHHLSYLSELLLERALKNPFVVGHELFWTLRSQLHFKPSSERFSLLLEQFLMLCGRFREELLAEVKMVEWLKDLGTGVKGPADDKKKAYLCERLKREAQDHYHPWTFAFDTRLQCNGMKTEGTVLSSAKKPILLTFFNSEMERITAEEQVADAHLRKIIFKVGDDMRQDILTIQLIRIMDNIWLENGLDLRMLTYRVSATHDQVGMVEFVNNAKTTADIQVQYGGKTGALSKTTFKDYLEENAKENPELYAKAVDNFIRSCAGYSVATYILGIGDRHNDNIMMTENGQLFHIDFGHFLGNFKSAMGINRERSAFVFTEEMAYVMNKKQNEDNQSKEFIDFVTYCGQAYNHIRRVGRRFIYLFQLMISAGMPELMDRKDILYMKEKLALNLTERQAEERFREEIDVALNNYFRRLDNLMHNLKHKKSKSKPRRASFKPKD